MEVIDIFKIPIFCEKLLVDNEKLLSYCFSVKQIDPGKVASNSGGWHSNYLDNSAIELKELVDSIESCSFKIKEYLKLKPIKLTDLWININGYKDFNWNHIHPLSVISGVYYVKTPENCGNIEFENTCLESTWKHSVVDFNNYNSKTWWLPSEEGVIYMFPSWLYHKVNPNLNTIEKRISISFNLS